MQQIILADLRALAVRAKPELQQAAAQAGRPVKIYAHWTAGHYGQFFDDYHISIDADGGVYTAVEDFNTLLPHTYRRNSGAISVALCCAYAAVSAQDLGQEPPTEVQVEALAQVLAVLAAALSLPIDIKHVLTHAEAADNLDGDDRWHTPYGPGSTVERWDLWVINAGDTPGSGGGIIRGKAVWYQSHGVT